jgi:hypothetical protein
VIDPVGTIYASGPSSAGASGNSITPIDPIANVVGQPVFVGSEPNKLAISDNGQVIYAVLSTKNSLLFGANNFKIENGRAFATGGRVADPEAGTLIGTYPVTTNVPDGTFPSAVIADSATNRVYFFMNDSSADFTPHTMLIRAFDMQTFLHVGTVALPNISGRPTAVVRWGTDGFAFRTTTDKVNLIQTSLIPNQSQPVVPAPTPPPPTFTMRSSVSGPTGGPPLPTFTVQVTGGQTSTTTTNEGGSFVLTGLPLCSTFTVTPVPAGNYTFLPASVTFTVDGQSNPNSPLFFNAVPKLVGFAVSFVNVSEGSTTLLFSVTRLFDTSSAATVDYQTTDGTASERSDYVAAVGTLRFNPNQSTKLITVFLNEDAFHEANETFTLSLSNPTGAFLSDRPSVMITITDNDASDGTTNPADDATFFVRQHYRDFLNRDPDAPGLAFWVNEITSCGSSPQCIEIKRINVSAAFFLSIEFQETGYFAYRAYKSAYGDATSANVSSTVPVIRFKEFLADAHRIGAGVQVGVGNWQQQLEDNKNAYALEFVQRLRFTNAFPLTMTADQFVSKLDQNTGGALSSLEKSQFLAMLEAAPGDSTKRAAVLRAVADNADLRAAEFNRAFVLMQYYGFLRRNPDDPQDVDFVGWKFWLDKLSQFNGNFVEAEMVKAFITSIEYRQRFGP